MILQQLSILNYKNIRDAQLAFSPKINCFVGHNGQGKTNLLDAVYYLSFCKSASNPVDSQNILHGEDFLVIQGQYTTDDAQERTDIYCGLKRRHRKHFKCNKKEYVRFSDHIGKIPLILVSPADAELIDGGSEARRKFMDVVIAQYDRSYLDALVRYNKALLQRNALLKAEEEPDPELMAVQEELMAESGETVFRKRDAFIRQFIPLFQDCYRQISGGREEVELTYISHGQRGPLLDVIRSGRAKDRIMGYSLHGIHKDDLTMTLSGYPIKKEGSQGQNKTFVLAMKLAQFAFLRETGSRTTPLLLLDDIFDKLDAVRVEAIIRLVGSDRFGQIFITDTNRTHIDHILHSTHLQYRLFTVSDGTITEEESTITEEEGNG